MTDEELKEIKDILNYDVWEFEEIDEIRQSTMTHTYYLFQEIERLKEENQRLNKRYIKEYAELEKENEELLKSKEFHKKGKYEKLEDLNEHIQLLKNERKQNQKLRGALEEIANAGNDSIIYECRVMKERAQQALREED